MTREQYAVLIAGAVVVEAALLWAIYQLSL
jgi:hypothetical protein